MLKKLSVKAWAIIIISVVLVLAVFLACLITATTPDKKRFTYELNENGISYSIVGIKNAYRGGWFAKETINVPETYKGYPVTSIKQIKNLQKTKTVILPVTLKEIGASAFYGSSITSLVIPNSVETVGISAFENCTNLTEVTLSDKLTTIPSGMFRSCFSLKKIEFPNSVTSIASGAFSNCYNLESITFSTALTTIAADAFSSCVSLTSIELPASLTTIGNNAFDQCYSLIEICNHSTRVRPTAGSEINGKVAAYAKHVYSNAQESYLNTENGNVFYDDGTQVLFVKHYGNETELTLPADYNGQAYVLYDYAFYGNSTIQEVVIPAKVTQIGRSAFYNCSALTKVTIGDGVTAINRDAFYSCKKLKEVVFGKNIETIGRNAFFECQKLESIELYDAVKTIGDGAFSECSKLKDVKLGKGLQSIGDEAFFNCVRFTELNFGGTKAQWEQITLGTQWTWDNNSNKRDRSCEKVICSDGEVEIPSIKA